ncbi:hypothetical protein ACJMK2_021895, partial [Sinanodonta woodiana]
VPLNSILQQEIQKLKDQVLHLKTGISFEQKSNISYFLAVTATASQTAQRDIHRSLGMKRCTILCTTPVLNENISINIRSRIPSTGGRHTVEGAYDYVYKPLLLELHRNKRLLGSLFWMDCERPDETACVVQFHSQHPEHVNQEILKKLSQDVSPVRLVFATIALGMGCDLRHVKRVIHACPPSTIESYTQEIGRAGRDGSIAQAMLFDWYATANIVWFPDRSPLRYYSL